LQILLNQHDCNQLIIPYLVLYVTDQVETCVYL